jgi:SAM-dependent methyltransferase
MNLERLKFGLLYRVGYAPWDGHELPARLIELVEGQGALPKGKAIDLGCGTGDSSIYLAKHGWDVVGVDFVERALKTAQAKGDAARITVRWLRADVTRLRAAGAGSGFGLLVDNGCLHLLSDEARHGYAIEVAAIAAARATLIVTGFLPGRRGPGPRGIDRAEIERRFGARWEVAADGPTSWVSRSGERLHWYELRLRDQSK